ncbi:hypothetical protein YA0089_26235 [Pseudomonas viridiflava]|uniref:hypothetical protein n=1 Tax=Pseudomonas viridiflava TaxID=33069 RepID=UPI0018E5B803|nr:hypothetical protein [Pseudomonas viridiflava]MBI6727115.1 hypothetical protein [Pseudomonas viridiflava]
MEDVTWPFLAPRQVHQGADLLRIGHSLGILRIVWMSDLDTSLDMLYENAVYPEKPDVAKHAHLFSAIAGRKEAFGVHMFVLQGRDSPTMVWREVARLPGLLGSLYGVTISRTDDSGGLLRAVQVWGETQFMPERLCGEVKAEQDRLMQPLREIATLIGKPFGHEPKAGA